MHLKKSPAFVVIMCLSAVIFAFDVVSADASLIEVQSKYLYDDENGIVWYQDILLFNAYQPDGIAWEVNGNLISGSGVLSSIDLVADGVADDLQWRLATFLELYDLSVQLSGPDEASFLLTENPGTASYIFGSQVNEGFGPYRGMRVLEYGWNLDGQAQISSINGQADLIAGHGDYLYMIVADVTMNEANPAPEPATLSLFGIGCVALAVIRTRRKKKQQM